MSYHILEDLEVYKLAERNFCFFSRGSILETKGWLIKSKNRNLINEDEFNMLFEKLQSIHLKLNAYLNSLVKPLRLKQINELVNH